jgi:N-acetylmuramoyl-L-alanine amidase
MIAFTIAQALTVCIDPGHPSEVGKGTRGKRITEIRAAWKVASFLKEELEKEGVKVVLTKSKENEFVKNRDRSKIANKAKADLMVRLHCDSQSGSGFAVYVPKKQGTAQGKTGPSKEVIKKSIERAKPFHDSLKESLKGNLKDNGLLPDTMTAVGGKFGALIGSIFSEVPVVLVEMCRLSNKKDEEFIASESGQKTLAKALAKATLVAIKPKIEAKSGN